ncbi:hypothetical protein RUM44_003227 [Polyplax serrata]|uniref:Uncharacterized protein n=1 Tax=Polyplax serrata TaxID=468196 RepID=A0ABR1AYD9_POLSC
MDEVKLTTAQRQEMKVCLKRGEPLPVVRKKCHRPSYVDENLFDLKRNYYFLRRGREQILHSGAYERERYNFLGTTVDLEEEKTKLQNLMAYGKNGKKKEPSKESAVQNDNKDFIPEDRVEQLQTEIEERLEFLRDMAIMGKEKEYQVTIRQEIWGKLREMQKLNKDAAENYRKLLLPTWKAKSGMEDALKGYV